MKSTGVYKCPDDSTSDATNATPPRSACSYGFNVNIDGRLATGNIAALNAPAKTVLLFEVAGSRVQLTNPNEFDSLSGWGDAGNAGWIDHGNGGKYATGPVSQNPTYTDYLDSSAPTGRHTDAANYAFSDGHVKWIRGVNISTGDNAAQETDVQVAGRSAGTAVALFQGTFSNR